MKGSQVAFVVAGICLLVMAPFTTFWLIPAGVTVGLTSLLDLSL